jgi:hypothetical protein
MVFAILGAATADKTGHSGLVFALCTAMRIVLEFWFSMAVLSGDSVTETGKGRVRLTSHLLCGPPPKASFSAQVRPQVGYCRVPLE